MATHMSEKSVVITGASSGIGEACARLLSKEGWAVFACVRDPDSICELVNESDQITPVTLDVTDLESVREAAESISNRCDGLNGLINNAGIPLAGPIEGIDLCKFRELLDVNVVGATAVAQAFTPLLRSRKGTLINMGSISGKIALPFLAPYAASKFALEAVTDALRVELAPWDIKVTIITPGNVATKIRKKAMEGLANMPEAAHDLYGPVLNASKSHSEKTSMPPHHVARLATRILNMAQPRARYIIGKDAKFLNFIAKLPSSLRDKLIQGKLPNYGPLK